MNAVESIKSEIIATGHALIERGLVAGTWGNISAKVPGTDWVAVTPSGRDYQKLTPADIVVVDANGIVVEGGLKPSSELPMHRAIYSNRPDLAAIVHTHSVFASACAAARKPLPPVIEDLIQLAGGSIEVADYALPGTDTLAENTVKALGDRQAVLLANHGVVGCGTDLTEAVLACELVEKGAQIYIYANQLGGAHVLSEEDVAVMRRFYLEHYRKRQKGAE